MSDESFELIRDSLNRIEGKLDDHIKKHSTTLNDWIKGIFMVVIAGIVGYFSGRN